MNRYPFTIMIVSAVLAFGMALAAIGTQDARAQESGGDPCVSNLKQLGIAVSSYVQDYDGALPPMGRASAMVTAVSPYMRSPSVANCPITGKPYKPNAMLSSKSLAKISRPGTVVLFRDSIAHPDGRVTKLYADGHIVHIAKATSVKS